MEQIVYKPFPVAPDMTFTVGQKQMTASTPAYPFIYTVGVSSCVAVIFYDPGLKAATIAHMDALNITADTEFDNAIGLMIGGPKHDHKNIEVTLMSTSLTCQENPYLTILADKLSGYNFKKITCRLFDGDHIINPGINSLTGEIVCLHMNEILNKIRSSDLNCDLSNIDSKKVEFLHHL